MRELMTADEIQGAIERRVNANREVREDGERIRIPTPMPLREADSSGCNWTVDTYQGSPTYRELVELAIAEAQRRWNLR